MKIVATDGCTYSDIAIDDQYEESFSKEQLYEIACKLISKLSKEQLWQLIWDKTVEIGNCKFLHTCSDCGDSSFSYEIEL